MAALAPLVLIALLALPGPARGALRWSDPQVIGGGGDAYSKSVHIDARGNVLALWTITEPGDWEWLTSTYYGWRTASGHWKSGGLLGPINGRPKVAISPRGDATAIWVKGGSVVAAEASAGGGFGQMQTIGRTDPKSATTIDIAMDDAGNVLAAWSGELVQQTEAGGPGGWRIYAATRSPDGAWSSPELVRHGTAAAGTGPDLAMNAAGAAVIGWSETQNMEPLVSYRPPAGRFGPAERVPSQYWGMPLVAIGDGGEAVVATASRSHVVSEPSSAVLAVRKSLGGWSDPLAYPIANAPSEVLVDPAGNATMFMTDSSDRDRSRATYVTRSAAGEANGPVTVGVDRSWGAIAMNLRGDVLTTLHSRSPAPRVEFAERPARKSAFSAPQESPNAIGTAARVALNDAGQAALIWTAATPSGHQVLVSVREDTATSPPPPPPEVDFEGPITPKLDGDGDFRISVRCSSACKASARGILAPEGTERLVAATGSSKRIASKRRGVLKLRFGNDQSRAVRKAIRAGRKPWIAVSVRARGRSPRPMTVSRRVRLR
jgi:hypothetical protein